MTIPISRPLLLTLVMVLLSRLSATADVIIAEENWNSLGLDGWTANQPWVTPSNPGAGGVSGGYLQFSLAAADPLAGGADWYALVAAPASSLYGGTWDATMSVGFDFLAADTAPAYVQVQWTDTLNNHVWSATVFDSTTSSLQLDTWTHMTVLFQDYQDWDYGGGNQQQFLDDLQAIDTIGVYVWRNTGDAQTYGIDNFDLMVPEPSGIGMLAVALMSSAVTLWKRRRTG